MGVMFFQNGVPLGSDAGWGGYTGSNNYVVRYDFLTGSQGASRVAINLDTIWTRKGAGNQSFGFRISSNATEWANARNITPISNECGMSYSPQSGYGCLLYALGLNLLPNTRYYLFVYVTSAGTEYYTAWNCVSPTFAVEGSYVPPVSSVSSISASVATLGNLSIVMNRSGGNYHRAEFAYNGTALACSEPFATSLSYLCPRSWLSGDTASKSVCIDVTVKSYSDASCITPAGSVQTQFTLNADRDMHPTFYAEAVELQAVNPNGSVSGFVSGISRVRAGFIIGAIDMTACAGAQIAKYSISVGGKSYEATVPEILSDVINGDTAVLCSVTDTRGCSHSVSIPISSSPYVAPSLTDIEALRCTSDGTTDENGSYYKVRFTAVCSAAGGECTVRVCVKPSGGSYGSETLLTGYRNGEWSDRWTVPKILGGSLSGDSLTVRLTVADSTGTSSVYTVPMYALHWAMKFNSSGTAVGFGMAPDTSNALQIPDHWRLFGGIPVLSSAAYGTASPENAVTSPVEGQIYLRLGT